MAIQRKRYASSNESIQQQQLLLQRNQKKSKLEDQADGLQHKSAGGIFDDLDEEMDPSLLDDILQQLSNDDSEEETSLGKDTSLLPNLPMLDLENRDYSVEDEEEEEEEEDEDVDNEMETIDTNQKNDPQKETLLAPSSTQPCFQKQLSAKFRDHYMGLITQAFGSDLDQLRQEAGFTAARLDVLIDSLESGISIFSDLEKSISVADAKER